MRTGIIIMLFFLSSFVLLNAQIQRGGQPMLTKSYRSVAPPFLLNSNEIQRSIARILSDDATVYGKKPLSIAVDQKVDVTPENSGRWINPGNGYRIWRLEVFSKDAEALAVYFDRFKLEKGVMLFLYDPDFTNILGGFNYLTNKESGILQTAFVPGESMVIELQVPAGRDYGEISVGSFSHAFVNIFKKDRKKDNFYGLSGSCEVDINCAEGTSWQTIKRSVCRIIFKRNSFTTDLCTGSLINNTSKDGKAYFYTANHCIRDVFEAQTAVLYFNYESEECNGADGDATLTLSGTEVLATSDSLDFSLLLLSEEPPEEYKPYFAGWSRSLSPPSSTVTIHHPKGDVKKISKDMDRARVEYQENNPREWLFTSTPGAFWRIEKWEIGATEGGSSGSPLFNPLQLIVGNLTGGDATCFNPVNDYFSKFFMNWDYYPEPGRQLKYWLDSLDTGLEFISGHDPSGIEEVFERELFTLYPNPGNGRFTIHTDTIFTGTSKIGLYNLSGKLMGDYSVQNIKVFNFDLSHLENGVYILDIITGGYREQKKIVILK